VVRNSLSRSGRSWFQSCLCYRLILLPKFTYLQVVIDKKKRIMLLHEPVYVKSSKYMPTVTSYRKETKYTSPEYIHHQILNY